MWIVIIAENGQYHLDIMMIGGYGLKLPRRWFRISGLNRFGLFDGISRWFAADSKCGPEPELLAPAPT